MAKTHMWGIIWLASYPKSGNTWVRAFIANYSLNRDAPLPINELVKYTLGDGFLIHYERLVGKKLAAMSPREIAALRPKVHEWFGTSKGQTVFVKTHNLLGEAEGTPLITPSATAGAIYIVRNPLDVAVSFSHHYRISLDEAVDALSREGNVVPGTERALPQYLGSWTQHVRSWIEAPGLNPLILRYEDLSKRPEESFGAITRFLNLPPEPERLAKAIRFSSFEELSSQEQAAGFDELPKGAPAAFFRAGRIGAWRDALSDDQVARLVDANRPVMTRFSYLAPDGALMED